MDINEFDTLYKELSPTLFRRSYMLLNDEQEVKDCVQNEVVDILNAFDEVKIRVADHTIIV